MEAIQEYITENPLISFVIALLVLTFVFKIEIPVFSPMLRSIPNVLKGRKEGAAKDEINGDSSYMEKPGTEPTGLSNCPASTNADMTQRD